MTRLYKKLMLVAASLAVFGFSGIVLAAPVSVSLGTADSFAVLAGSGITIGGAVTTSTITGDIGSYATPTITGIGNAVLSGTNHAGDATTQGAKNDLSAAYGVAQSATPATTITGDLGTFMGGTLTPGVYNSASSIGLTGTVTLDGQGDPNAVFIFQAGSTLTTAGASTVTLINGAQACNVFWQVGTSATLGAASFFEGNILADQSIGLGTTANVEGRVLARTGAVTLNGSNIITKATCAVVPPGASISTTGGTGAHYFDLLPAINITKIPAPLSLPSGAGPVTYTYVATNIGKAAMANVWVKDDICADPHLVSGDTNANLLLDLEESWTYTCTKTVSKTETNTATAHGYANGIDVYDTANATVVVGVPLIPPLIHLLKTASVGVLPAGGGAVTYTYVVTNPGVAPLSDVSITDNKCTGLPGRVIGHPGDTNNNNLLEPGETWTFTCASHVAETTTNIGTAEGHANGLTAIDFSPATVVVASPSLPNTGFPPLGEDMWWYVMALVLGGIIGSAATSVFRRGRGSPQAPGSL